MRFLILVLISIGASFASAQDRGSTPGTILYRQLKTTHDVKDWFVPINDAVKGMSVEQALWKQGEGNHSIGELVHHLVFWNERLLNAFKGHDPRAFSGNNEETFEHFDGAGWQELVKRLDDIMREWGELIDSSDEEKLQGWYENIANISTHNAYHTGQIVYIRKLQGSWDPAHGVK